MWQHIREQAEVDLHQAEVVPREVEEGDQAAHHVVAVSTDQITD